MSRKNRGWRSIGALAAQLGQGEIDRLTGYMPLIARSSSISESDRRFAISITSRLKRGGFAPSDKQIYVMRRLVETFQRANLREA